MTTQLNYRFRHLTNLTWPLASVLLVMAIAGGISLQIQATAHDYLNGESLWSKGQKNATYFLSRYADSHNEQDYLAFQQAISMSLHEPRARLVQGGSQDHPLNGGNASAAYRMNSVPGQLWLLDNLRSSPYLAPAFHDWQQADKHLQALSLLAQDMHSQIRLGHAGSGNTRDWHERIGRLNSQTMALELRFSQALDEGTHLIQQQLLLLNLIIGAVLTLLCAIYLRRQQQLCRRFENAFHNEKNRTQTALAAISEAVITTDAGGLVSYMNPAAQQLTSWHCEQALGLPLVSLFRIVDEHSQLEGQPLIDQILTEKDCSSSHSRLLIRLDGSAVAVACTGRPIHGKNRIQGAVLILHNMTRERQYLASLSWQSAHDALTGLVNRREFERCLEKSLAGMGGMHPHHHALIFMDLDQFKLVNDTCGHAAGDELLRQVCLLLQQQQREHDTVARLGGDEFGILLEHCSAEHAGEIAETLRQTIQSLHFSWKDQPFNISASIGLVLISSPQTTMTEALRAADVACYMAKEKGRNRTQLYHPDDAEFSMRFGEMAWVQRIHLALEEQRFCLYAQEISPLDPLSPEGIHIELLLRLHDEVGRMVPPASFIPAAERYGLMPLIDRWVVHHAFATVAARLRCGKNTPINTCAINLSGNSIGDADFLDFLHEQFRTQRIPPQLICFEITETSAIANLNSAMHFISDLKKLGCRFSLDDFGAGMSSFTYLKHLQVDYLKIDGGFVKDMLNDATDHAMVEAINQIGHVMGKKTIAEFVETTQIAAALKDIGVDYAQGYAIARPRPFSCDCEFQQNFARDCLREGSPESGNKALVWHGSTAEAIDHGSKAPKTAANKLTAGTDTSSGNNGPWR